MNLSEYLPLLNILGFIFLGIGFLYVQLRVGGKGVAKEVIDNYRTRQDQLEAQLGRTNRELQDLKLEIARMNGQVIEKDKKIEELTTIFQNRNPELVEILKEIRNFMHRIEKQTTINQTRNIAIDKATDIQEGHVLRKK